MDDLAARTDALAEPLTTRRIPLDGATAVHTPERRDYRMGNVLALDRPPERGSLPRWLAVWREELGAVGGITRTVLQWEDRAPAPPWLVREAGDNGMTVETDEILVLSVRRGPAGHPDAAAIGGDEAWEGIVDLLDDGTTPRSFLRWRLAAHRERVDRGDGQWWAVMEHGRPVAGAGIFWGDGLLRFQEVVTAPTHRRRGLATGLVAAMLDAHGQPGRTVIIAELDGEAARLYRRLGFTRATYHHTLVGQAP